MNLTAALKAIAPAVGDGRLVWQHAHVLLDETALWAHNGSMWATMGLDTEYDNVFLRYDALTSAMSRDGAELIVNDDHAIARAGRSRLKLKRGDASSFPKPPSARLEAPQQIGAPAVGFVDVLRDFSDFCGAQDNHIWQMGVHFREDMAFACDPFSMVMTVGRFTPAPVTIPPWATKFILAQEDDANVLAVGPNHIEMMWNHRAGMTSTLLIQEPPDAAQQLAIDIREDTLTGMPVPFNLKEAVQRAKALGATSVKIGDGRIEHVTDEIEFVEDVDITGDVRTWGVGPLLMALEHAVTINLMGDRGRWEGNGYKGVFAGMRS